MRYIKEHRKSLYTSLQLSGNLSSYLADIDHQAEAMLSRLVEQMAQRQGVTEKLKASDQMAWVGRMNNIRASAIEIVDREINTHKYDDGRKRSLPSFFICNASKSVQQ